MNRLKHACAAFVFVHAFALIVTAQSVYPTGTTIYDPERTWNGYTVLSPLGTQAVLVIDMNGNVVKRWDGYVNSAGGPARIFPGGVVMAANGARPPHQESLELIQRDFEGHVVWRFGHSEQIEMRDGSTIWSARQHHDWQREDFPAGYYSPASTPQIEGSNTLILTHTNHSNANVADEPLEDDRLIEVSWDGNIVWEWVASDHIDELGFADDARKAIKAAPGFNTGRGRFRLAAHQLGDLCRAEPLVRRRRQAVRPEQRDHQQPASQLPRHRRAATARSSGGSVPISANRRSCARFGQIIGQHHAHFIPKGLPGAGNLLVFDNGGASGYGFANPIALDGYGRICRARTRACSRSTRSRSSSSGPTRARRFLQLEHQQRAETAERQYAHHRRRQRTAVRGHQRRSDRLGIHLSDVQRCAIFERRLPGLPSAV